MSPQGGFGQVGFGQVLVTVTTTNQATAESIIRSAYRKINHPDPTPADLDNAVETLSNLLPSLFTQRLHVNELVHETFNLVAGTNRYSIGPDGTFNTERPIKIMNAYITTEGTDYLLDIETLTDYSRIRTKTVQSIPNKIYYAQEYPLGIIFFDYVPAGNYTLTCDFWKPLLSVDELQDVIILPLEYNRPLIYNLAIELAPEVNQKPDAHVIAVALQSLEWLTHVNGSSAPNAQFDAVIPGCAGKRNILTDEPE